MILQIVDKLNKRERERERERESEEYGGGGGWMVGCDETVDDLGWSF